MKMKKTDILGQKKNQLNTYKNQFIAATKLVTETVENLATLNGNIDATIAEIEEYENELTQTKAGLAETKEKNERVIKNFKALLEI